MYVRNKRKTLNFRLTWRNRHFSPILGQKLCVETKIFGKFRQWPSGKSSLQEVLDMPKAKPDLSLFLVVSILTKMKIESIMSMLIYCNQWSIGFNIPK